MQCRKGVAPVGRTRSQQHKNTLMFTIAQFELRKKLRQLSTYVYFSLFFAIAYLVVIAAGGAFAGANVVVAGSGGKTLINSPFVLTVLIGVISYFGMIVMAAIMGQAIYQDFHYQTHTLFFTSPISKFAYLGGRYLGAFITLALVFSSIGLGAWVGTLMPFVEHGMFGPNRLLAYLYPYLVIVLPNMLFIGAVFFSLAALARRILPVYAASVIFLIGYMIAGTLTSRVEEKLLAAILDPFGLNALSYVTRYWTVAERNEWLVPFAGALLWNRLLWLGASGVVLCLASWRFRFQHGGERLRSARRDDDASSSATASAYASALPVPVTAKRDFRALRCLPGSIWLNLKETVKNVYFVVIVLAGVLFMVLAARQLGSIYGTETYPVTASIVEVVGGSFTLFVLIIITFYAGEIVWRERDANMQQIYDVLPIPNWLPFLSKTVALCLVQVLLMAVVMLTGIAIQASQGYFRFECDVYVADLFGIKLISFFLLCILAITVQVVVNHKYLGHFVMVLYYLVNAFMGRFGFEHKLYDYAGTPGYTYSDMNRFGHFLWGVTWFNLYWAASAVLLAMLANLLWARGTVSSWDERWKAARSGITGGVSACFAAALLAAVTLGGFIYYNTNVLNRFETRYDAQVMQADYEKTWKKLEKLPQPRITDVQVAFDLFTERRDMRAKGTFTLVNKTKEAIPAVYVRVDRDLKTRQLALGDLEKPSSTDARLGMHTFTLSRPMAPGDSISLKFDLVHESHGFRNDSSDTEVVYNGTFFNSTLLPHVGYWAQLELGDDDVRRKHGLAPKPRMASIDDEGARRNNYISSDADWITLDAVVSTSPDQIAIVPGYLRKEWTEGGRRYFHYTTEGRILHFFSVLSARYQVRRDTWRGLVAFGKSSSAAGSGETHAGQSDASAGGSGSVQDVAIEIYYHRGHEYNLDRMIEAVKASLDYYTKNFGPYQHRQLRIVEFPRYSTFAQSFPNTIPYSEAIGFVARIDPDDPEDVDYPYYVTAHEIAHQWWAHQVIGGNVQGSTLMSESLSQYSALMVMKQKYGAPQMRRFLRYELEQYLMGRATERKKELPLALNENQGYIHYNKGSLVMYALQDYLGEERVNKALARYVRAVGYQDPPYTISREFLGYLREAAPNDMRYLIEDMFETITLFDNRAVSARYRKLPSGKYEVKLTISCAKMRADEQGREVPRTLDDLLDVGLLDERDRPLLLEKHRIRDKETTLTLVVDKLPAKAGVDPLNKLIDRIPGDNTIRVEAE